jgi:hypothetical protein
MGWRFRWKMPISCGSDDPVDGLIHEETIKSTHPDGQRWFVAQLIRAVHGR